LVEPREWEITEVLSRRIEAARTGDLAHKWHEVDPDTAAEGALCPVGAEGVDLPTSAL
jgi:hypothetical protein